MKSTLTCLALGLAAVAANAQDVRPFAYTGVVTEVVGDPALVGFAEVGDDAFGGFALDLEAPGADPFVDPFGNVIDLGLNFYEAVGIDANVNDVSIAAENPTIAAVLNDVATTAQPDAEFQVFDQFTVGVGLSENSVRIGQLKLDLVGSEDWLDNSALPTNPTLGFESLLVASVTIEFNTGPAIQFDDDGFPITPDPSEFTTSYVTIQLETLSLDGNIIATIGCKTAQLSAPAARADNADIEAFADLFVTGDRRADINGDNDINAADLIAFETAFRNCACNCGEIRPVKPAAISDRRTARGPAFTPDRKPTRPPSAKEFVRDLFAGEKAADLNGDKRLSADDVVFFLVSRIAG